LTLLKVNKRGETGPKNVGKERKCGGQQNEKKDKNSEDKDRKSKRKVTGPYLVIADPDPDSDFFVYLHPDPY
jgi:hypothetical protein